MITTIISIAALLIGFGLAWILKSKQAPAESIILQNNYDKILITQKEQIELIEILRTSEKEVLAKAITFETKYNQQLQELQLLKSSLLESQQSVSDLQRNIAVNAEKQQAAEDSSIIFQQQVVQLKVEAKQAEATIQMAQRDSSLQEQELTGMKIKFQNASEIIAELKSSLEKKADEIRVSNVSLPPIPYCKVG